MADTGWFILPRLLWWRRCLGTADKKWNKTVFIQGGEKTLLHVLTGETCVKYLIGINGIYPPVTEKAKSQYVNIA